MICNKKKYIFFGPCGLYKRGCTPTHCSYMKQKLKSKTRDQRKRDKAMVIAKLTKHDAESRGK